MSRRYTYIMSEHTTSMPVTEQDRDLAAQLNSLTTGDPLDNMELTGTGVLSERDIELAAAILADLNDASGNTHTIAIDSSGEGYTVSPVLQRPPKKPSNRRISRPMSLSLLMVASMVATISAADAPTQTDSESPTHHYLPAQTIPDAKPVESQEQPLTGIAVVRLANGSNGWIDVTCIETGATVWLDNNPFPDIERGGHVIFEVRGPDVKSACGREVEVDRYYDGKTMAIIISGILSSSLPEFDTYTALSNHEHPGPANSSAQDREVSPYQSMSDDEIYANLGPIETIE